MKVKISPFILFAISLLSVLSLLFPAVTFAAPVSKNGDTGKFTVVIDAGHGGKDTGAIDNNVKEKDINLGVALKLADLIRKRLKDVKVVMTRDNDTFLTLQERADKANKSKGNLFISIHTNSVDKSNKNRTTVAGVSVYALGLHKDQNNMKVAQRENAVIELESNYEQKYSGFDPSKDESYIIFEMAQKKNLSQSIKFANEAQKQLVSVAGRKDRGVHQAGFWVLWATSMPAVLVELDFICNPTSAAFISSEKGQKELAEALFNAVKTYSAPYTRTSSRNTSTRTSSPYFAPLPDENEQLASTDIRSILEADDDPVEVDAASESVTVAAVARRRSVPAHSSPSYSSSSSYSSTSMPASSSYSSSARAGSRKRRSASSRAKSVARNLETSSIRLSTERDDAEALTAATMVSEKTEVVNDASGKKDKKGKKDNKKSKTDEKVRKSFKKVYTNPNPSRAAARRSTHSTAAEKSASMRTVYKIQLLASEERLKDNASCFCGLTPISTFRENNLYKYTYGESENKSEMEALLKEVKSLIPGAKVIKVTKLDQNSKG